MTRCDAPGCRSLDRLQPGQGGLIVRVEGEDASARRLMELGLGPGAEVLLVRRAPLGDPVEVRVRGVHLSVRQAEARRIHVTPR